MVRVRAGPVKRARIVDIAAGLSIAAPAPWISRATMSAASSGASAPTTDPAVRIAAPARNMRRRPKTSAARPEISSSPPKLR